MNTHVQFQLYLEIVIPDQINHKDVKLELNLLPDNLPITKEYIAGK